MIPLAFYCCDCNSLINMVIAGAEPGDHPTSCSCGARYMLSTDDEGNASLRKVVRNSFEKRGEHK